MSDAYTFLAQGEFPPPGTCMPFNEYSSLSEVRSSEVLRKSTLGIGKSPRSLPLVATTPLSDKYLMGGHGVPPPEELLIGEEASTISVRIPLSVKEDIFQHDLVAVLPEEWRSRSINSLGQKTHNVLSVTSLCMLLVPPKQPTVYTNLFGFAMKQIGPNEPLQEYFQEFLYPSIPRMLHSWSSTDLFEIASIRCGRHACPSPTIITMDNGKVKLIAGNNPMYAMSTFIDKISVPGVLMQATDASATQPLQSPFRRPERQIAIGVGGRVHLRNIFNPYSIKNGTHLYLVLHYVPTRIHKISMERILDDAVEYEIDPPAEFANNLDSNYFSSASCKMEKALISTTSSTVQSVPSEEDGETYSRFYSPETHQLRDGVFPATIQALPEVDQIAIARVVDWHKSISDSGDDALNMVRRDVFPFAERKLAGLRLTPFATYEHNHPTAWPHFTKVFQPDRAWPVAVLHIGTAVMREGCAYTAYNAPIPNTPFSYNTFPYIPETSAAERKHYGIPLPVHRDPLAPKHHVSKQQSHCSYQVAFTPGPMWEFC